MTEINKYVFIGEDFNTPLLKMTTKSIKKEKS
jgi:hypothetical protein